MKKIIKQKIDVFKPNNIYFWGYLIGVGLWTFIVSKFLGTSGFWLVLLGAAVGFAILKKIGECTNKKRGYS
jgi:hypothetical protein